MGAKFKFDGEKLTEKNKTTTIASVRGNKIFAKTSYSTTANIRGSKIYDGNSATKVVANIRSGYLCSENSSSKIRKMKDIDNEIDGPGEEVKAALWFYFCQ
ncbi:hypothetical protein OAC25_00870 [Candidatus Thioglobus sp.]|nr:hypothetical protein [Candidatus Thioglobus sp.]MDB9803198.1 hypothetical protein [Candidatus Thioglobus sp.]